MPNDYFAFLKEEAKDAKQHGVKGMHWGVVRDSATKIKDHLSRKAKGEEVTPTKKAAVAEKKAETNPGIKAATGEETSSARYSRLASQAKEGKSSDMSEQDLKFFNARTEALNKINKLNEVDPGWLSKTSKKVLQQAAQNTMQSIADGVAKKYISSPILDSLNKVDEKAKT